MRIYEQWEVVRGDGPQGGFVELWDLTRAPSGLAFEARQDSQGSITLTGYGRDIPIAVAETFMAQVRTYFG